MFILGKFFRPVILQVILDWPVLVEPKTFDPMIKSLILAAPSAWNEKMAKNKYFSVEYSWQFFYSQRQGRLESNT